MERLKEVELTPNIPNIPSKPHDAVKWDEGIIARWEKFLRDRYPIGPRWARAMPTALVSMMIKDCVLKDKMGDVKANIFVNYIGTSGLGCKSPPLRLLRSFISKYMPDTLMPTYITPQSGTEWFTGTHGKLEGREKIDRHTHGIIIRDEASTFFIEAKQRPTESIPEFLSEMFDGYIDQRYTRTFQLEGGLNVYVSMSSASTELFLSLMEDKFFIQGLGNRILWVLETAPEPTKKDQKDFFDIPMGKDKELDELIEFTKSCYNKIYHALLANVYPDAAELWCQYDLEKRNEAYNKSNNPEDLSVGYGMKMPLHALKLAMIYAASRLNVDKIHILRIQKEDIERALGDMKVYEDMYKKTMSRWRKVKTPVKSAGITKAKIELEYVVRDVAEKLKDYDGYFTIPLLREVGDYSNKSELYGLVELGVQKGYFTEVYVYLIPQKVLDKLNPAKQSRPISLFYKLTDKGKQMLESGI